ncbi:hypothetical protein C7974DRAFT_452509 [Boeremia exigua]|uniref:uncharacterized protein n=1 Tax=Boeremia exigua TaxID=749465 RepID=UPI001E8DD277|nr:uncharacterized protein C7974DRAFT_452509 [Boeremia exigua]KAH6633265.1 hypothetical protein C7974DRAFT_452509 [Boeremia exigua]
MLRLKPSELTLTPEDIDETFQRMARRRQARAPVPPAQRRAKHTGRPPPPRLVPGAQRSVNDAVTHLGNIPLLRPRPQQAVIAHVDDDSEGSDGTLDEASHQLETSPDLVDVPSQPGLLPSALSAATAPRHSTRLPFRLGLSRRTLEVEREPHPSPTGQADDSEGTLVEPASSPLGTTNVSLSTPGRSRPKEPSTRDSPPLQSSPSATPASLRGGASRPQRDRVQSIGQESLHAPSPLRQTQVPGPTLEPDSDLASSDEESPVRYLQGYFKPNTQEYTFEELVQVAPRTEPSRKASQPQLHSRSRSFTDAPPLRFLAPTPNLPPPSREDMFWDGATPAPGHATYNQTDGRPRQHSSEMSNMSLAYSYYELPESRQSSGEYSSLFQSQYDVDAGSREPSRGTYRSVRLSEAQVLGNATRSPTPGPTSFQPPIPMFSAHMGASPLPAEPYGRTPTGANHQPTFRQQVSETAPARRNAIVAAVEDDVSPLEALTAHIGRESQRLGGYQGQPQRSSHLPGLGHPAYNNPGPVMGAHDPRQFMFSPSYMHVPQSYAHSSHPFVRGSQGLVGQPLFATPSAFGSTMAMADDPYTRGVSAHVGQVQGSGTRPSWTQALPASYVPPRPRSTQGGRNGQRSSENAPASTTARVVGTSQVQEHAFAFGQIPDPAPTRSVIAY